MSNSEDMKKMREALSDYYELARKLRDDEIREAGYAEDEHEGMLRAEEAIHLFDAHIAALSQPTAQNVEIDRLAECLKKANEQAEHFEREWYLRGDEIEKLSAARVPQSVEVWIDDLEDAAVGYVTGAPEAAKELARTASKNLRTFMAGKALVPVEPSPKMIDATFNDEIETSGEIESHNTRNRRIYKAMLTASKEEPHND